MTGYIFDLKRFAVHDGPGIRSTLFLKGCPLRCLWCHNPEGLDRAPRLWFFSNKCMSCGLCLESCPRGALSEDQNTADQYVIRINHELCDSCSFCTRVCPTGALEFDGKAIDSDEAVELLLEDRDFYTESGGGITLSGGDPLAQPGFAAAILEKCKNEGIHTAVETALYCSAEDLDMVQPYTDMFLCDLKIYDDDKHRRATSVSNEIILENIRTLALSGKDLLIRTPLIPRYTAEGENLAKIGSFLRELGDERGQPMKLELLNYNSMAPNKYKLRNEQNPALEGVVPVSKKLLDEWQSGPALSGLTIISEEY